MSENGAQSVNPYPRGIEDEEQLMSIPLGDVVDGEVIAEGDAAVCLPEDEIAASTIPPPESHEPAGQSSFVEAEPNSVHDAVENNPRLDHSIWRNPEEYTEQILAAVAKAGDRAEAEHRRTGKIPEVPEVVRLNGIENEELGQSFDLGGSEVVVRLERAPRRQEGAPVRVSVHSVGMENAVNAVSETVAVSLPAFNVGDAADGLYSAVVPGDRGNTAVNFMNPIVFEIVPSAEEGPVYRAVQSLARGVAECGCARARAASYDDPLPEAPPPAAAEDPAAAHAEPLVLAPVDDAGDDPAAGDGTQEVVRVGGDGGTGEAATARTTHAVVAGQNGDGNDRANKDAARPVVAAAGQPRYAVSAEPVTGTRPGNVYDTGVYETGTDGLLRPVMAANTNAALTGNKPSTPGTAPSRPIPAYQDEGKEVIVRLSGGPETGNEWDTAMGTGIRGETDGAAPVATPVSADPEDLAAHAQPNVGGVKPARARSRGSERPGTITDGRARAGQDTPAQAASAEHDARTIDPEEAARAPVGSAQMATAQDGRGAVRSNGDNAEVAGRLAGEINTVHDRDGAGNGFGGNGQDDTGELAKTAQAAAEADAAAHEEVFPTDFVDDSAINSSPDIVV